MEEIATIAQRVATLARREWSADGLPTLRQSDCERCNDTNWEFVPGKGTRPCPDCSLKAQKARLLGRIPDEYAGLALETIEPQSKAHPKQAAIITKLRQEPERSYVLLGANGSGKTLFGWLLYRRAVESGRLAVGVKLSALLTDYRRAEFDDSIAPAISPETLLTAQTRYLVFVDDITVAPSSEYAGRRFYELMDAAKTKGHQIVITAHLSAQQVADYWDKAGYRVGAAIMRRIVQSPGVVNVDLTDDNF